MQYKTRREDVDLPHINIYNVQADPAAGWRDDLKAFVEDAVARVAELGVSTSEVSVCIPYDPSTRDDATIMAVVEILFDKPERTLDVRQDLAGKILAAVKGMYPKRKVEVFVPPPFDASKGVFVSG